MQRQVGREWPGENWEWIRAILGSLEPWPPGTFAFCSVLHPGCLIPFLLVSKQKKTYQCIKCQMTFENEREIQIHVANHMIGKHASPPTCAAAAPRG